MTHDVGKRIDAAVAAVRRHEHDVAKGWNLEVAAACFVERNIPRACCRYAGYVVVVLAEQIEAALQQPPHTFRATRIGFAVRRETRKACAEEIGVREIRA